MSNTVYNKQHNIVFVHAITPSTGFEWNVAESIGKVAKMLNAKEIVSLEGVGSGDGSPGERVCSCGRRRFDPAGCAESARASDV